MRIGMSLAVTQPGGSSGPPALHILDHFTGTDGTQLTAHTPDTNTPGNAWAGNLTIYGNAVTGPGSAVGLGYIDCGVSDAVCSVAFVRNGGEMGILMRFTDSNNFWRCENAGGSIVLYEVVAGGFTARASAAGVADSGTMVATVHGTSISVTYDSKSLSYPSATSGPTKFGLYLYSNTPRADNFEVTP